MAETWNYLSSVSVSMTGDFTATYWTNQRVKFVQNTTTKYFVIYSVTYSAPNTIIVLTPLAGSVVENLAITDHQISWFAAPRGFPNSSAIGSGGRGAYSAIIYISGGNIIAEYPNGTVISSGTAGTADATILQAAMAVCSDNELIAIACNVILSTTITRSGWVNFEGVNGGGFTFVGADGYMSFSGAGTWELRNLKIIANGSSSQYLISGHTSVLKVTGCEFTAINTPTVYGYIENKSGCHLIVTNNVFTGLFGSADYAHGVVTCRDSSIVSNNVVTTCKLSFVLINEGTEYVVSDNLIVDFCPHVTGLGFGAIECYPNGGDITNFAITGNTIRWTTNPANTGACGIVCNSADNHNIYYGTISGNLIKADTYFATSHLGDGIDIEENNGNVPTGISITGNTLDHCGSGILANGTKCNVVGNTILNCVYMAGMVCGSLGANNFSYNIIENYYHTAPGGDGDYGAITANYSYNMIHGNIIRDTNNLTAYCIQEDVSGDYSSIEFNDVRNVGAAVASKIVLAGSHSHVKFNEGHVTENTGSSTGTGASQTLAHGLVGTPKSATITPTVASAAITYLYANASSIVVTVTSGKAYTWAGSI